MKLCKFPEQNALALPRFSTPAEGLVRACETVFATSPPMTGYLQVVAGEHLTNFIFFLQGEAYAAGRFSAGKPASQTLAASFDEIVRHPAAQVSLHAIDPVLLKSFLVFLQEEPTIKAPVNLIDLEQIVRQIFAEAGDALIVLEKDRMFNFYFVKGGKTAHPHLADTAWSVPDDLTFDEQILMYAFEPAATPVTAYVYRNVATSPAADIEQFGREAVLARLKAPPRATPPAPPVASPQRPTPKGVTIEIVAGAQQGARLTAPTPCLIGRKECDLVINDQQVSRRHAQIDLIDGGYILEDLGSTNGTFVNGVAAKRAVLTPVDVVTIGETRLKIIF